ncbi:putative phage holin [Actinomadura litoris]|uniref:putative phage holin n=1 Tax=Actinomadura litoris TaxID=2678616 RepID=UPI001FA7DD4F|nr:hypothetical protein [Actinomadura litoris]
MSAVHTVGTVALWLAFATSTAFCVAYHLTAPWWRSGVGRHLMSFTGALALVLGRLAYRSLDAAPPPTPGDEVGRTVVYSVAAALMIWQLALLYQRQIRRAFRRDQDES